MKRYDEYLDAMNERMDEAYSPLVEASEAEDLRGQKRRSVAHELTIGLSVYYVVGAVFAFLYWRYFLGWTFCTVMMIVLAVFLLFITVTMVQMITSPQRLERLARERSEDEIAHSGSQFDSFRSLSLTKDREFLMRFERPATERNE